MKQDDKQQDGIGVDATEMELHCESVINMTQLRRGWVDETGWLVLTDDCWRVGGEQSEDGQLYALMQREEPLMTVLVGRVMDADGQTELAAVGYADDLTAPVLRPLGDLVPLRQADGALWARPVNEVDEAEAWRPVAELQQEERAVWVRDAKGQAALAGLFSGTLILLGRPAGEVGEPVEWAELYQVTAEAEAHWERAAQEAILWAEKVTGRVADSAAQENPSDASDGFRVGEDSGGGAAASCSPARSCAGEVNGEGRVA
jgi:hypothetical protein